MYIVGSIIFDVSQKQITFTFSVSLNYMFKAKMLQHWTEYGICSIYDAMRVQFLTISGITRC